MPNLEAAIQQVQDEIAKIDEEYGQQMLAWDSRQGVTNLPLKVAMSRRNSLLVALDALQAAQ